MDYVVPKDIIEDVIDSGKKKLEATYVQMLIKGLLAGIFLGYATTLAFTVELQTKLPFLGAIIFPVGFVIIILLGLDLVTGNFAILNFPYLDKKIKLKEMNLNFFYVLLGNLIGSVLYALLYYGVITKFGTIDTNEMITKLTSLAEAKTLDYKSLGLAGIGLVFTKAILCNWMVTLGAIMAFTSKSTIGKIVAMWLPIMTFFAQGFEHAIVNMFVIPIGMMLGADVSFYDWWVYNQIPVLIGNFIGGFFLTALTLYYLHKKKNN